MISHADEIKKAIEDIDFDIPKHKKILIKPNILGQHTPEQAVTTHPAIVEAIVKLFHGNDIYIGDSTGLPIDGGTNKALEITGMKKIADKHNCKLVNLETFTAKIIKDENAKILKELKISGLVFDVDLVINVPKLKTHTLMRYTGAVKNLFGTIPGGNKSRLHALGKKKS